MKKFTVRAPATSANIGAGFDCMGLALDLFNEIEMFDTDKPLEIITDGCFPADGSNLVYRSMEEVFRLCGRRPGSIGFKQINRIPPASGLGSSAACVVAGVAAANELLGRPLNENALVKLCTKLDGHPDNVVPCIKGGVTAGAVDGEEVYYIGCCPAGEIALLAATPPFGLKTELSRSVLPDFYSRADTVYSLQRAVVTFAALIGGRTDLLKVTDDKLHTPYRRPLIEGFDEVNAFMKNAGALCSYLSGAGPTVMGIFAAGAIGARLPDTLTIDGKTWTLRRLTVSREGVCVC